jgi:hypothetical protein
MVRRLLEKGCAAQLTCFSNFLYTRGSLSGPIVCFTNASKTETMMEVSRLSRKQMKKTGTANTFTILRRSRGSCMGVKCKETARKMNTLFYEECRGAR